MTVPLENLRAMAPWKTLLSVVGAVLLVVLGVTVLFATKSNLGTRRKLSQVPDEEVVLNDVLNPETPFLSEQWLVAVILKSAIEKKIDNIPFRKEFSLPNQFLKRDMGSFMRSNDVLSLPLRTFSMKGCDGILRSIFHNVFDKDFQTYILVNKDIELVERMRKGPVDWEAFTKFERNTKLIDTVGLILDELKMNVDAFPNAVRVLGKCHYDRYRGSDREKYQMVGGYIFLRIVNPYILDMMMNDPRFSRCTNFQKKHKRCNEAHSVSS